MAYVGGKSKNSEHILNILNNPKYDGMRYLEPFVGYAHVLRRVNNKKSYKAYDANPLLIELLRGIQKGKKYPDITKTEYEKLKKSNRITFRRAIAAFCYSYNGKEWGGYTISSSDGTRSNYPSERKRYYNSLRKNDIFMNTKITLADYKTLKPKNMLIYCDPPYRDTTDYNTNFDHDKFWNIMRKWSNNNIVLISEYAAPSDFKTVSKRKKYSSLSGKGASSTRYEKLFSLKNGKYFKK